MSSKNKNRQLLDILEELNKLKGPHRTSYNVLIDQWINGISE
jgi:hypothetical protein